MRKTFFTPIILILLISHAHAAELTLGDCIAMAKERNSRLKAFAMDTVAAGYDEQIAHSKRLPSLKFDGQYTVLDKEQSFTMRKDVFGPGIPPNEVDVSAGDRDSYSLALRVEQPIYTGGNLTHSLHRSRLLKDGTIHSAARQETLLVFEVKRAFYDALREKLSAEIVEQAIIARKERIRVTKEQHKEGIARIEDILRLETDLSALELDRFRAGQRANLAVSRLKRLIYYEADSPLDPIGKPKNAVMTASLPGLVSAAITNRDDLKESLARIRAAGEDVEIARSGLYPNVSIEGSYLRQEETEITKPDVWMLAARMNWTLFDWQKTQSEVSKAQASRERLRYSLEELQKEIILEVEEAWITVREMERVVAFREEAGRAAEYYLSQALASHKEGTILPADLLDKEAGLVRAYKEYVASLIDLSIAHAYLEAAVSEFRNEWMDPKEIYQADLETLTVSKMKVTATGNTQSKEDLSNNADTRRR